MSSSSYRMRAIAIAIEARGELEVARGYMHAHAAIGNAV
eukprot:SAG22_NODE_182_length_16036_cov_13.692226_4_plen_39_part_00